jgi:hypothetical protein
LLSTKDPQFAAHINHIKYSSVPDLLDYFNDNKDLSGIVKVFNVKYSVDVHRLDDSVFIQLILSTDIFQFAPFYFINLITGWFNDPNYKRDLFDLIVIYLKGNYFISNNLYKEDIDTIMHIALNGNELYESIIDIVENEYSLCHGNITLRGDLEYINNIINSNDSLKLIELIKYNDIDTVTKLATLYTDVNNQSPIACLLILVIGSILDNYNDIDKIDGIDVKELIKLHRDQYKNKTFNCKLIYLWKALDITNPSYMVDLRAGFNDGCYICGLLVNMINVLNGDINNDDVDQFIQLNPPDALIYIFVNYITGEVNLYPQGTILPIIHRMSRKANAGGIPDDLFLYILFKFNISFIDKIYKRKFVNVNRIIFREK